jgi:hypothetical protein
MVTVDDPVVAVVDAVKVAVLPLKLTVTPVGRLLAVKVTVPVNPPVGVTVIVLVPVPPWVTFAAVADSEKFAAGPTVRVSVAVLLRVPLVPVIVILTVPTVAVLDAVKVATSPLKLALTPVGNALTAKVTVPVNPPAGVTVIVSVALLPWMTDRVGAESASVKPLDPETGGVPVPMMIPRPLVPMYTVPKICGSPVMV